ncbi:excalibur calcium-binding domain-containing protein [Marinomonas algicola]|uniref:excalibur calcium-binding domain-containing protein n=1 Tax=Marinomonas algicola TaxID=2773454 RepID=UPI0023D9203C|nr:excalibur calcium-binding domain-containing protein [Marinomonas algicola]
MLLIAYGAWDYYSKSLNTAQVTDYSPSLVTNHNTYVLSKQQPNFTCDGRQHCSQMNSRAEAVFFINNCPDTKMDGDHDGVPCENDSRY